MYSIFRRHHTWSVRVYLSKDQQALVGRPDIVRTLKTRDHKEAKQRAPLVAAQVLQHLAAMHGPRRPLPASDPMAVIHEAQRLRALVEAKALAVEGDPKEGSLGAEDLVSMAIDAHIDTYKDRDEETGYPILSEEVEALLGSAYRIATDPKHKSLKDWIEQYLGAKKGVVRESTLLAKRRNLTDLVRVLGGLRDPRTVTRTELIEYVEGHLKRPDRQPKTVKDDISNIRAFFGWLMDRDAIDANPCDRLMRLVPVSRRGRAPSRRPWAAQELLTLLSDESMDPRLRAISCIGLYSGMRLEEICAMRNEHVLPNSMRIMEGKSNAAVRVAPTHPLIQPLVQALKQDSPDGYLIPKLIGAGPDEKRGKYMSKRFAAWRKESLPDAKGITFHTLRNTFMTACENEGAPLHSVKLIVGHSRSDITYGLYSAGPEFQKLAAIVERVSYGAEVDARAKELAVALPAALGSVRSPKKRRAVAA